jgi:hypothetical protein
MEPVVNDNNAPQPGVNLPQPDGDDEDVTQDNPLPVLPALPVVQEERKPTLTIYDRRSERFVEVEVGRSLSDYWGQCQWHSHGIREVEPDRGPQTISDLFLAGAGDYSAPLYVELCRAPIADKPFAATMRGRIEQLVQIYRDLERIQSAREDGQALTRRERVWAVMSDSLKEQDAEDLKARNIDTTSNFKVPSKDPFNSLEVINVGTFNTTGQKRQCGPALYVLSRTYAELAELVAGLVCAYRRANPVFIHNMATEHSGLLKTFWSPTPRPAYDASGGPDCNGNPLGQWTRYAAGTDPKVDRVQRDWFSRSLAEATEPSNVPSQRRVVRRYYPEDTIAGRWDVAGGWDQTTAVSLDDPVSRRGRWAQAKNMAMPDDPVRRAGISGDHFTCCQMPRDHPGCFTDTYSTTTNQPVRYKAVWKRLWSRLRNGNVDVRGLWLASTRRGTQWLDKSPYQLIHERIQTLKAELADHVVRAVRAQGPLDAIRQLGPSNLNRLVQMLRLEDEYNSYFACNKWNHTLALSWIKRIGETLLLDRLYPDTYKLFIASAQEMPDMQHVLVDKYARVFEPSLRLFEGHAPPQQQQEELESDEEEEEGGGGGLQSPPPEPQVTSKFLDIQEADKLVTTPLPSDVKDKITAMSLYTTAVAVLENTEQAMAEAPSQFDVFDLTTVRDRVIDNAETITKAVQIQLAAVAFPGQYTTLKDAADMVVQNLQALLAKMQTNSEKLLTATDAAERSTLKGKLIWDSGNLQSENLVIPAGFPTSKQSANWILAPQAGGGEAGGLGGGEAGGLGGGEAGGLGGGGGGGLGGGGGAEEAEGGGTNPSSPVVVKKEQGNGPLSPLPDIPFGPLSPSHGGAPPSPDLVFPSSSSEEETGSAKSDVHGFFKEDDIADIQGVLAFRFQRDAELVGALGLTVPVLAHTLQRQVPIWNEVRHRFLNALAQSPGNGGSVANDAIAMSGNTVLKATQKALALLPVMIRLDVADRFWGRHAEGNKRTTENAADLIAIMKNVAILFNDAVQVGATADQVMYTVSALELYYGQLDAVLPPLPLFLPADDKLFDPLALVEEVSRDFEKLAVFLDTNKDATKNTDASIRYWRIGGPTPNYDDISGDIARVLKALGAVPSVGTQEMPVPNLANTTTFLNLDAEKTGYLFAKGATEGSIATKLGFAIQRENQFGGHYQYLVQRIQEFDYRLGVEPEPDLAHFRIPVGWTKTPPVNSWWALSVFLSKYATFLNYVIKVLRLSKDTEREQEALETPLYNAKIASRPKRLFANQLEAWLVYNYETGKPPSATFTFPDGYAKFNEVKNEPNNSAIPNLAAYIEDSMTAEHWDDATSAEDVQSVVATATAAPPDLGDTDWSTWE